MTIDELTDKIKATSPEDSVQYLAAHIRDWKLDDSSIEVLQGRVNHFIGHTCFSTNEVHNSIHAAWSSFCSSCIDPIHGMTMNERLYCFGLFNRFDSAQTQTEIKTIYDKLLAHA